MVADLIHLDQDMYGTQNDPINMALRRYAGMAMTNLTFGDVVNKVGGPQPYGGVNSDGFFLLQPPV